VNSSSTATPSLALQRLPTGIARQKRLWRRTRSPWPRPGGVDGPGGVSPSHPRAWPSSPSWEWAAEGLPPARSVAPAGGSRSSPPAAAGDRPSGVPSGCGQPRSRGDDAAVALGAAALAHHPADQAIRGPVTLLQDRDDTSAALLAQKCPLAQQGAPIGATRSHCSLREGFTYAEALRARASPSPTRLLPEAS
jgi:hypothetical protein